MAKKKKKDIDAVAVIGLGRFGRALALELQDGGVDVLGIDVDMDLVQSCHDVLYHVVQADATKEDALRELGVPEFSHAVVAVGSDLEASILVTSWLIKFGVPQIWAKAISDPHEQILTQLGVQRVISPEKETGTRIAHVILDQLTDYIPLTGGFALVTKAIPDSWRDRRLGEINLRGRRGLGIVAVRRETGEWIFGDPYTEILDGDTALVVGPEDKVTEFTSEV